MLVHINAEISDRKTQKILKAGPHLPVPLAEHCMLKLSETEIMIIGGENQIGVDNSFIYDTSNKKFIEGPKLNHGR